MTLNRKPKNLEPQRTRRSTKGVPLNPTPNWGGIAQVHANLGWLGMVWDEQGGVGGSPESPTSHVIAVIGNANPTTDKHGSTEQETGIANGHARG